MIKVEAIENFNLEKFNELKNIKRKSVETLGKLYAGDTFECSKDMAKYLSGDNVLHKAVVKVIEVIPEAEKETKVEVVKDVKKKHKNKLKK